MLYVSIFILLLMLLFNILFRIASVFRLGVPLAYGLFVPILFPKFTQQHQTLATVIFFVLIGMVALSWSYSIRKRIRRKKQQHTG